MADPCYVVRCPQCSGFSVTRAKKVHRCPYCGQSITISDSTVIHVADDPRKARHLVSVLKGKRHGLH
ncbi:MAG: hypothetical protein NZ957_03015 [Thaumarchaeota archaeon]|nr:hypothetical protein [Candidatus Calditenuaceae archaeon]MDW8042206.1 hypothetical protein [Nitrososphaerota archaeon]